MSPKPRSIRRSSGASLRPGGEHDLRDPRAPPRRLHHRQSRQLRRLHQTGHVTGSRVRAAATRAKQLYPGPVGELLERELMAFEELGFRFGAGPKALGNRLVDHILQKAEVL